MANLRSTLKSLKNKMLDIVFISYDEPFADENFALLKERFPYAMRVHGVKGIAHAHFAASKKANTRFFYVVDADAKILPSFNFDYKPSIDKQDYTHIWKAYNAIIDDSYGYGGVKLFSKKFFKDPNLSFLDFSTTLTKDVEYMDEISCNTEFYYGEKQAFRGAFREASKLTIQMRNIGISESMREAASRRLDKWLNPKDLINSEFVYRGVIEGINSVNKQIIDINDFTQVDEKFKKGN